MKAPFLIVYSIPQFPVFFRDDITNAALHIPILIIPCVPRFVNQNRRLAGVFLLSKAKGDPQAGRLYVYFPLLSAFASFCISCLYCACHVPWPGISEKLITFFPALIREVSSRKFFM